MKKISPLLIYSARKAAGLSLEKASKELNIKPSRLKSFENGRAIPTPGQAARMSYKYNVNINNLFMASDSGFKKVETEKKKETKKKKEPFISSSDLFALIWLGIVALFAVFACGSYHFFYN